ncbi:putative calcium/proton antiporter [plant metagenome]|uniref:Putative calcium/proton antiporter n=1 Tax=plant metagenome TaxID=1297885 RepID=A0A484RDQ9_9ZZZZ
MAPLPPSPALSSPPDPRTPRATWLRLALAWAMVAAFTVFGPAWLAAPLTPLVALAAFLALFLTILAASFGVVHEADGLAHKLGEPYGTLILTLSIVLIEVILIASVLLGPGEFPTIGRDSIFAVMMIIVNLVMGICLVAGGLRHGEQEFNAQGAGVYLSMIMLLTAVSLVLPNFLAGAGEFDRLQGWAVAALTGALYAVFLWLQMRGERRLFIQPPLGQMEVRVARRPDAGSVGTDAAARSGILRGTLLLIGMIVPIVLLAHHLAIVIDYGVATVGAPVALSGVLIAIIVFTPESITAVKAALNNEMQRAVNLCLGAFVSTVGLTVPAVLVIGLVTGKTVTMGISGVETVLLVATVWLATLSFKGQRTSVLQGVMHLGLFALYGFLLFGA